MRMTWNLLNTNLYISSQPHRCVVCDLLLLSYLVNLTHSLCFPVTVFTVFMMTEAIRILSTEVQNGDESLVLASLSYRSSLAVGHFYKVRFASMDIHWQQDLPNPGFTRECTRDIHSRWKWLVYRSQVPTLVAWQSQHQCTLIRLDFNLRYLNVTQHNNFTFGLIVLYNNLTTSNLFFSWTHFTKVFEAENNHSRKIHMHELIMQSFCIIRRL